VLAGIPHAWNTYTPPVVHEIAPGSIVDHNGTPAIKSTKGKHDPNLPIKHWWITEPVAEAVAVAEQLSEHHDRLFPPLLRKSADVSRSHQMLDAFINHINPTTAQTGLEPIPPGAACLDNAIIPEGHKGPRQDRCRPDRCVNSVIGPEHLPIWATERQTLLTLG
jgi:hypothetical protein